MNKNLPLFFSISIHIILFIIVILLFPTKEVEVEQEIIKVQLVFKKEEKIIEKRNIPINNVDIIDNTSSIKTSSDKPKRDTYIDELSFNEPDLVILNKQDNDTPQKSESYFNKNSFEDSLSELMPMVEFDEDIVSGDDLNISWDGDKRDIITNSNIDFSSFPKNSFTGVGVKVNFTVNPAGEVFNVSITPPGSGSIDFDILIKQYVLKFKFKQSETNSIGEVLIVYKK